MMQAQITYNEDQIVAHYEFEQGDRGGWLESPTQPTITLWKVETIDELDLTSLLNATDWNNIQEQLFEKHEL